jgi:hypothetical protein
MVANKHAAVVREGWVANGRQSIPRFGRARKRYGVV